HGPQTPRSPSPNSDDHPATRTHRSLGGVMSPNLHGTSVVRDATDNLADRGPHQLHPPSANRPARLPGTPSPGSPASAPGPADPCVMRQAEQVPVRRRLRMQTTTAPD